MEGPPSVDPVDPASGSIETEAQGSERLVAQDGASTLGDPAEPEQALPPTLPSSEWVVALVSAVLVLAGVGWSLASATYSFLHRDEVVALLTANTMSPEGRRRMVLYMLGGAMLPPCVATGYLAFVRRAVAVLRIGRVSRLLSPLLLAFFLPVFFNWKAFAKHELLLVISLTGFALLIERLLRVAFSEREAQQVPRATEAAPRAARFSRARQLLGRVVPRLPFALSVLAAAATALYLGYYTILNHYRLQTSSWDLAIFDNMMWNLMRGEWFKASPDLGRTGSHIQYHANFIAYLFVPLYALRQHADTLLAIQAMVVGAAAIPLFLVCKLRTGSGWVALVVALAYCLHGPMHGPVFYDFHFLTLSPFFVLWVLYLFEAGRKKLLIVAWLAALLVREDTSACMSAAALFFLVSRQRPWWAFYGGLLSAVYFVVMKFGIMPLHRAAADKETFTWMFKDLVAAGSQGYGGVLKTILTNPLYALNAILDSEKLSYLLKMFGPVLLLPLRSPKPWIMFLPAALFTLLSSGYKPLYQTYFQYTSNWTPYLFFGVAVVLAELAKAESGRVRQRAGVGALLVSCVLFSYHHGAILQRENFRGGFRKVGFQYTPADQKKYAELMSLVKEIPKNASVAASETEAPHVSNRENCFTIRFGHDDADYLLLSVAEARTGNTRKHLKQAVDSGKYGFVRQSGGFMLWRRGAPVDKNPEGLKLIGPEPKPKRKK